MRSRQLRSRSGGEAIGAANQKDQITLGQVTPAFEQGTNRTFVVGFDPLASKVKRDQMVCRPQTRPDSLGFSNQCFSTGHWSGLSSTSMSSSGNGAPTPAALSQWRRAGRARGLGPAK